MSAINCPACGTPTFVGVTEAGCPLRVDSRPALGGNLQPLDATNGGYPVLRVYSADEATRRRDLHRAHYLTCTAQAEPTSVEDILAWRPKRASDDNNQKETTVVDLDVIRERYATHLAALGDRSVGVNVYIGTMERSVKDVPVLLNEVERLRTEMAAVVPLVRDLTDEDSCWFDHHGGCQAHGYLSLEPGEKCPQQEAKEFVEAHAEEVADRD